MADTNSVTVQSQLRVFVGNVQYPGMGPSSYETTILGTPKGPTPGAITVPLGGVAVDLSELDTPGMCELVNQDENNFVEVGIRDPGLDVFYPMLEIGPGEKQTVRLSRNLLEEYQGTGTGTTGQNNQLWIKADTAPCVVYVGAFER